MLKHQTDKAALDRAYNARAATTHFDKDRIYAERSHGALHSADRIADVIYDDVSGSKLDIYPVAKSGPLFVWIHGGWWRTSSKDETAFVAPGLLAQGINVASIDYTLAPKATLDEIVRQTRASIAWLHSHARDYGIDASVIHVGGHSAGGQLVGMLLADNWQSDFQVPVQIIGTALPISGLMEMEPLRHYSFVNDSLNLDDGSVARNSPVRHIPRSTRANLIATCGGDESEEFHWQTDHYVDAWRAAGHSAERVVMPGYHHFDIILELERAGNPMFDALIAGIKRF